MECQRSAQQPLLDSVLTLKTTMITTTTRNWIVNDLLRRQRITLSWEKKLEDLQFQKNHKVLECQRSAQGAETSRQRPGGTSTNCSAICGSLRTVREERDGDEILGTAVTCSGIGVSMVHERSHQLVHQNVQNLFHGHDVGELLHGALLDPFLWPRRLC